MNMVETASKVNGFVIRTLFPPPKTAIENSNSYTSMIIQVYEIQSPEEAQLMLEAGVDHIGSVIVSQEQWKDPELKAVIALVQQSGCRSSLIPLFEDESAIARCADYYRPDILHFCENINNEAGPSDIPGSPPAMRQLAMRERFPEIEMMRSIPVADAGNGDRLPSVEMALEFAPISDWLLIDTYLTDEDQNHQPVDGYVGITGRICDWGVARQLVEAVDIPVILAGGIGPDNAYDAAVRVAPAGIDSCTNTNAVDAGGRPIRFSKDATKVRAMVKAAQKAQQLIKNTTQ
jgi:phosphoribosylanthranilate isomerase